MTSPEGDGMGMIKQKGAGVLIHVTSLPSTHGIGDMGSAASILLPFLKESGQEYWQILPIHPVGYGDSPYQSYSAFAGNENFISVEGLMDMGLLLSDHLQEMPEFEQGAVDFEKVRRWKTNLYKIAFNQFRKKTTLSDYEGFKKQNQHWLQDYCLFRAIKEKHENRPWTDWPRPLRDRFPSALSAIRSAAAEAIEFYAFLQHLFFRQWEDMRAEFRRAGIQIIGDLPIFVSHDSADVWANRPFFQLDNLGQPTFIAGVPPDYFSKTGQRWGNPHYRWEHLMQEDFLWWRARITHLLRWVDIIRIDHFRGFEASWAIDARESTAVRGSWVKAPGEALFHSMEKHLGKLPLIAEDLGVITREVEALKKQFGFPGMKILQFSFHQKLKKKERPAYYEKNTFAYTGTHDNDTLAGWLADQSRKNADIGNILRHYHHIDVTESVQDNCRKLISLLMNTNAGVVIIPMQDYLCLGTEARMNYPGTVGGNNWRWRCPATHFREPDLIQWILKQVRVHERF